MPLVEEIHKLLEPYLEDGKYFVVDLLVKPSRMGHQVTVLVDSDEGITISECASISRRLGKDIEARELFDTAYNLEVSSPGLDQPLRLPRQYAKNIGRNLKINLIDGSIVEGKLTSWNEEAIDIELPQPKKKKKKVEEAIATELSRTIPIDQINKALVQVSFK